MNSATTILVIMGFIALNYSCNSTSTFQAKNESDAIMEPVKEKFSFDFSVDSGYILANEALCFLVDAALIDTTVGRNLQNDIRYFYTWLDSTDRYYHDWWNHEADTIGKYYRLNGSENLGVVVSLGWNDILLMELTPQSALINYDLHGHGSHPCCWSSFDDILQRYGDYLGVMTCGTGSAYCSGILYLYKDKIIPHSERGIAISEFVGSFGKEAPGHILSSTMHFEDSCLIVSYDLEIFYEYITDTDKEEIESRQMELETKQFTVKYIFRNNRFETDEGYKLEGILL